jgi:hypothetical protein
MWWLLVLFSANQSFQVGDAGAVERAALGAHGFRPTKSTEVAQSCSAG